MNVAGIPVSCNPHNVITAKTIYVDNILVNKLQNKSNRNKIEIYGGGAGSLHIKSGNNDIDLGGNVVDVDISGFDRNANVVVSGGYESVTIDATNFGSGRSSINLGGNRVTVVGSSTRQQPGNPFFFQNNAGVQQNNNQQQYGNGIQNDVNETIRNAFLKLTFWF